MRPRKRVATGRAVAARTPRSAAPQPSAPAPAARGLAGPRIVDRSTSRPRAGSVPPPTVEPAPAPVAVDLSIDLAPTRPGALVLRNPLLVASGTFGYGIEYGEVLDVERLGAICCKGTTLKDRKSVV